jgi:hypothetical protein
VRDLSHQDRERHGQRRVDGALEHCIVRFTVDEMGTDCMLGANGYGLYLSSSIDALEKATFFVPRETGRLLLASVGW